MTLATLTRQAERLAASITDATPAAEAAEIEARHAEVIAQIREHSAATIRQLGKEAEVRDLAESAIENGDSVEAFRSQLLAELVRREAPHINNLAPSTQSLTTERTAITSALIARAIPGSPLAPGAERFSGATIADVARHLLGARGNTFGMSPADAIGRAFHSTSDFPIILGNIANAVMRAGYDAAPAAIKAIARQSTAASFKAKTSFQLSAGPTLEKVNEHGEFKRGSLSESKESYRVETFGKIFAITRQSLVNDDVGAFDSIGSILGASAAEFEASFLVKLLEANPTMSDSTAVFHASHTNLLTAAALSVDALGAARLALRTQKGLAGEPIAVAPKFLVVPAALETKAEQVLATIAAATPSDVNPFSGRLTLVVEPRLVDPKAWYLSADPASAPSIEYSYLAGSIGPQLDTRVGFDVDGVETKVRLDLGAGFLDHRGIVKNPGV